MCLCVVRVRVNSTGCCSHNFWLLSYMKTSEVECRNLSPASDSTDFGRSVPNFQENHLPSYWGLIIPEDPDRLSLQLTVSKSDTVRLAHESSEELRHGKVRVFFKLKLSLKLQRILRFYSCWVSTGHGASLKNIMRKNCGCRSAKQTPLSSPPCSAVESPTSWISIFRILAFKITQFLITVVTFCNCFWRIGMKTRDS